MEDLKEAIKFAEEYHQGQKRKFTGEDYFIHLQQTAEILKETDPAANVQDLMAAFLHDVIEDTTANTKQLEIKFGTYISNIVQELTIDKKEKDKLGKKVYLSNKMNEMSNKAFTIKLCDRLSNVLSLIDRRVDKNFTKWYVAETEFILNNLKRELNIVQEQLIRRLISTIALIKLEFLNG